MVNKLPVTCKRVLGTRRDLRCRVHTRHRPVGRPRRIRRRRPRGASVAPRAPRPPPPRRGRRAGSVPLGRGGSLPFRRSKKGTKKGTKKRPKKGSRRGARGVPLHRAGSSMLGTGANRPNFVLVNSSV